jgi:integrase
LRISKTKASKAVAKAPQQGAPGVPQRIVTASGTRATTDEQLLESWLASLNSPHTRRNFETTARRFLDELPAGGLRAATVEDTRDALERITGGMTETSARQLVLRVKSLLGYAHRLGYAPFNAGATIKVRSDAGNRGAELAKRIITPTEVSLLIRAAPSKRDRVLLEVLYAGGLRVSEIVALTWSDVLAREEGRVQLSITGKGGKVRKVLLPAIVSARRRWRQRSRVRQQERRRPPDRARRAFHGQARGGQGRHQPRRFPALAAPRAPPTPQPSRRRSPAPGPCGPTISPDSTTSPSPARRRPIG